MSSPFAPFTNATLRFQVASGNLVVDRKGDFRPGKTVIEIRALLQQKKDPNREPRPGVDSTAIWVEGYITQVGGDPESLVLPSVITPDSPCQTIWQGRAGQFSMEFTARNPYLAALSIDLVERIRGYFQPGSFVVQGEPWSPSPATSQQSGQYSDLLPAATALSALRIVATNPAGQLIYASSNNSDHAFRVVGLLANAVALGESARALTDGPISDPTWNWTVGQPVFLGINGTLTQVPPETGFSVQVAIPVTSTQLDFEIQEPILL